VAPWAGRDVEHVEDTKQARREARERVGAYYEAELGRLLDRVAEAIDRYRRGELDVYEVDDLIHHYKQATRKLWSFCWGNGGGSHTLTVARLLDDPELGPAGDWWEQAERRRR
jgi:hypothetical protein